jgi:hypothetical protein
VLNERAWLMDRILKIDHAIDLAEMPLWVDLLPAYVGLVQPLEYSLEKF